ncbi:rho guanine nucleotide exchange factor 25-like [Scaptodrosophila lebanonensis]|uniref:Rho guanine nucleotide exchange factor 25-like n=1 Tax=Drosophila lebanonensis TaxID=7225 RepID=A0A6J2UBL3_DROLE|nr:rho guanine nucleotide exchange factor 25-like [Scaptodrosophila lebanonensis]
MYYYYAGNQPLSELIINAHHSYFNSIREILGHHINLSGLTLKLVQRIALYEMWLKQLTEQSLSAGLIEEAAIVGEAYQQMNITVKKVQELLTVIPNLHGFNGDITDQGNLLLQGPLTCCIDVIQKHFELYVYLFQRIILFADIEKVKPPSIQTPKFNYRTHIHVHNMHLKELGENSFLLKSIVLNLPVLNIVCQAPTAESYSEWIRILNSVLVKPSKP